MVTFEPERAAESLGTTFDIISQGIIGASDFYNIRYSSHGCRADGAVRDTKNRYRLTSSSKGVAALSCHTPRGSSYSLWIHTISTDES